MVVAGVEASDAHHLVGLIIAHVEPDPDVSWDDAQLARSSATVHEMITASEERYATSRSRHGGDHA